MHEPMIPDALRRQIIADVQQRGAVFGMLSRRPPKPRPWYRRAWSRIDRYLPRVRVSLGPDAGSRFGGGW